MSEQVWYRSLYWRIGVGVVVLIAALLVVQVLVFAWVSGRMTDFFPTRSPAQLAAAIATDIGDALLDPDVGDLAAYIDERHGTSFRSYVVVVDDARPIVSQRVPAPPELVALVRARLFALHEGPRGRGRGRDRPAASLPAAGESVADTSNSPDEAGGSTGSVGAASADEGRRSGRDRDDRFDVGRGPGLTADGVEYARVAVDDEIRGLVGVPVGAPPLALTLGALGPTLGVVALTLLFLGTGVAAVVIGRPTRRRLQELQQAARALGAGQPDVRAPESGGDEVTALARAFNEMAARLDSRTRALASADKTRRQLLADVSHELMTPLAAIRGYVETLSMQDLRLDDHTRGRYLSIVSDEANRLEHVIGDLLDLARLEGGGAAFRIEDVSVDQLLERLRHRHEPVLVENAVTLRTSRDPDLPVIRGDGTRLEQALQNLVANAIRHTPAGGLVTVDVHPVEGGVSIRVEDTGRGIPAEHLPHVFDRFYKVDASRAGTTVPSGSGLGLSIVQAVVERHGGRVTATNVPEGGARFEIFLPVLTQITAQ